MGSFWVITWIFLNQKAHFEAVMDQQLTFFIKFATYNYLILANISLPNQVAPLASLGGLLSVK